MQRKLSFCAQPTEAIPVRESLDIPVTISLLQGLLHSRTTGARFGRVHGSGIAEDTARSGPPEQELQANQSGSAIRARRMQNLPRHVDRTG